MRGRRLADLLIVSAAAIGVVAATWASLVSAQDGGNTVPESAAPGFEPPSNPTPPALLSESGAPADGDTEVLTRGAVHEAFAQPVVFNPSPGTVVAQQPPDPVEELPPDQKPAGDNVTWIPGYWTWEADQQKFIWTSGIWRAIPAGYDWVPGYWTQADGGFRWVNGFWKRSELTEVAYYPKPPETLEAGAQGPPPSADYVWIPGCWIWRGTHYAWRGGYWALCNPDWIWVPSYYAWTPSGYVFVEGHWDYAIQRRGVIFAPVVFRPGFVFRAGYVYTPAVAMDFDVCTTCLFCRPGFCCYCFGDYYAANYAAIGIYPWFAFHARYGYDPCFAYYNWHYGRTDPRWRERLVAEHRFRLEHPEARPVRTFVALRAGGGRGPALAVHINELAVRRGGVMHFERVNAVRRQEIRAAIRDHRVVNARRMELESRGNGFRTGGTGPTKLTLPKSTLTSSPHPAHSTIPQHANPNAFRQQTGPGSRTYHPPGRSPTTPRFNPRATPHTNGKHEPK